MNDLPAIFQNSSIDRHEGDARIAANTTSLHCRRLIEPGWIDPDVIHTVACSLSRCADLQSIYVSNRAHRSLLHLKDHEFVDTKGFTRQRKVSFAREPEVRLLSAEWLKDPSLRQDLSTQGNYSGQISKIRHSTGIISSDALGLSAHTRTELPVAD